MSGSRARFRVRRSRRAIALYFTFLAGLGGVLAIILPIGGRIVAAPGAPAAGAVLGGGTDCLGPRVYFDQSGVFLALRDGAAESVASAPVLAEGRLDRRTGSGALSGRCASGSRLGSRPVDLTVTLDRDGGSVSATFRAESAPVPFRIKPVAEGLQGPASGPSGGLSGSQLAGRLLLAIAVVIIVARVVGSVLARVHQPRVIGEIVAGILLGPSLLGVVAPGFDAYLFPPEVTGAMRFVAQLGLVFFMFLVGLELDHSLLRRQAQSAVVISHASVALPLALGVTVSLVLYPLLGTGGFAPFALFIGAAMAVTAFPVLARILTDTGLHRSRIGAVVLTCAAIDDVTAWCILAGVIGFANATGAGDAIRVGVLTVVYVAVMLAVVRPVVARLVAVHEARGFSDQTAVAAVLAMMLLSGWVTELIGIHAIFGAFLAGSVLPRSRALLDDVTRHIEQVTLLVLLPVFFAVVGLSTRFGLVDRPELWAVTVLVILAAVAGKWGGAMFAARATGSSWRAATAIGILMNTRGLTEIIILTIGREIGVLSPTMFAIMVMMALATTLMATPLLSVVYPRALVQREADSAAASRQLGRGDAEDQRVVVGVGKPTISAPVVAVAGALRNVRGRPPTVVLAHVTQRASGTGIREALRSPGQAEASALEPVAELLRAGGGYVEIVAGFGDDPGPTLCRLARSNAASVVLVGQHHPYVGDHALGGLVGDLLRNAPCDVAIVLDPPAERPSRPDGPVAVIHDGATGGFGALDLALSLARGREVPLLLLEPEGVAPPDPLLWAPDVDCERRRIGPDESLVDALEAVSMLVAAVADGRVSPLAVPVFGRVPTVLVHEGGDGRRRESRADTGRAPVTTVRALGAPRLSGALARPDPGPGGQ